MCLAAGGSQRADMCVCCVLPCVRCSVFCVRCFRFLCCVMPGRTHGVLRAASCDEQDPLPSPTAEPAQNGVTRFRPYASPDHHVTKARYITSNDPRGYMCVRAPRGVCGLGRTS